MVSNERDLRQWAIAHGGPELVTPHQFSIAVDNPDGLFTYLKERLLISKQLGVYQHYPLATCPLYTTAYRAGAHSQYTRISLLPENKLGIYVDALSLQSLSTTSFNNMLQPYGKYITRDIDGVKIGLSRQWKQQSQPQTEANTRRKRRFLSREWNPA